MRISDWSSDVCSSVLLRLLPREARAHRKRRLRQENGVLVIDTHVGLSDRHAHAPARAPVVIGRTGAPPRRRYREGRARHGVTPTRSEGSRPGKMCARKFRSRRSLYQYEKKKK